MAYLGSFGIDDYVGIPAATHRFTTGAAYVASVLTYSIYEEATAVGLDEDVDMVPATPFDTVVGCYWVRRQLTAAAGFEAGKNYLVVVKATVDSVAAITLHTFQVASNARLGVIATGTAQAADATHITLAAAETFAASEIIGATVLITGGTTGVGQARTITAYGATADQATVDAWTTTPTGTITYVVFATPPSSVSVPLPVNVRQVNGVALTGDGTTTPWGPA